MDIFDGLDQLCDDWLGVDDTWGGVNRPRYKSTTTFDRLCVEGWRNGLGRELVKSLDQRIFDNWSGSHCTGNQNWRFLKIPDFDEATTTLEVPLERTISRVTDDNWVNQVPVASGVDNTGPRYAVDLVHRCGPQYSFFELKVGENADNAVSAAFQILKYGLVFAFFRNNVQRLRYSTFSLERLQILRAERVHLRVLAPHAYYEPRWLEWLEQFENAINAGLQAYSTEVLGVPMDFGFEAFPASFIWEKPLGDLSSDQVQRNALWAIHDRRAVFGDNRGVGLHVLSKSK